MSAGSRRQETGSALGRWLSWLLIIAVVSVVLQQFVIPEPAGNGQDWFNDVTGISINDEDVVEDGSDSRDGPRASGAASEQQVESETNGTRELSAEYKETSHLELTFLIKGVPVTRGRVRFQYGILGSESVILGRRAESLEASPVAKILLRMPQDSSRGIFVTAQYWWASPGSTGQPWVGEERILLPQPWPARISRQVHLREVEQHLVCKGIVVDVNGLPIPWSMIRDIEEQVAVPHVGAKSRYYRKVIRLNSLPVSSDGSFEILTKEAFVQEKLFLNASAPGYVMAKHVAFAVGQQKMRVVLQKAGTLAGELILPMGVEPDRLMVGLFPMGSLDDPQTKGLEWVSRANPIPMLARAKFLLKEIPPGRYELSVGFLDARIPLVRVSGIQITGGEESKDLRVQKLDLRHLLKIIYVSVRTGKSAPKGRISILATIGDPTGPGAAAVFNKRADKQGNASLIIPSSGVDLRVLSRGFRTAIFRGIREDIEVTLQRDAGSNR